MIVKRTCPEVLSGSEASQLEDLTERGRCRLPDEQRAALGEWQQRAKRSLQHLRAVCRGPAFGDLIRAYRDFAETQAAGNYLRRLPVGSFDLLPAGKEPAAFLP